MFLENETWELCPVKSNFNIAQLHVSESKKKKKKSWIKITFIHALFTYSTSSPLEIYIKI